MTTSEENNVQYDDEFIYSDFNFSEGSTPPMLKNLLNRWISVKIIREPKYIHRREKDYLTTNL